MRCHSAILLRRAGLHRAAPLMWLVAALVQASLWASPARQQDRPLAGQSSNSGFAAIMKEMGVQPDEDSIRSYLVQIPPDEQIETTLRPWLVQLGDPQFAVRQAATEHIRQMPSLSPQILRDLETQFTNPEVRMRIRTVIEYLEHPNRSRLQYALFRFIADTPVSGLGEQIIDAWPYLIDERSVRHAASRALGLTAVAADVPVLANLVVDDTYDQWLRLGALRALSRLDPDRTTDLLNRQIRPETGKMGLEIAHQLTLRNDRRALDVLLRLSRDADFAVASRACSVLGQMLGPDATWASLNNPDSADRTQALLRGQIAKLGDDFVLQWHYSKPRLGRMLVADYENGRVLEIDQAGNVHWEHKMNNPFACVGLPNGHRLVTSFQDSQVTEFDANGEEVMTISDIGDTPTGVFRLGNGNTLVSCGQSTRVIECAPDGSQVRAFEVAGGPSSIEALENGNFLVALSKDSAIAEIDHAGNVLSQFEVEGQPWHATPLETGNILVAFRQESVIREYDPLGGVVWEHECQSPVFRADRLSDGSTVFGNSDGVFRVFPNQKRVALMDGDELGQYLYVHAF